MRESRTYGSGRGACHEMHVPTATTRREFITLLGGAAAAWPLGVHAQQSERVRRIGVLMSSDENNIEEQARVAAFLKEMQRLGWADGRNAQFDIRWGTADADRRRRPAAELVALAPEVILASGGVTMQALTTRAVADRVCASPRSGRRRLCRQPIKTGRQHHWIYQFRLQHEREMA